MAKSASGNVDILIRATDRASPVLNNVANNVRRLPESFAKSAAALTVLEGGLSSVGSQAAQAVGKVTGLASLMATGGALGIGIAAVSVAVAAGSKIWEVYTAETRAAEDAQRSLARVFDQMSERLGKSQQRTRDLADEIRYYGLSARDAAVARKEDEIAAQERGAAVGKEIEIEARRIEQLKRQKQAASEAILMSLNQDAVAREEFERLKAEIPEREKQLADRRKGYELARSELENKREQLAILKDLADEEKRDEESKRRAAEATRKAAEEERKLKQEEADRIRAAGDYIEMEKRLSDAKRKQRESDIAARNSEREKAADERYRRQHADRIDAIRKEAQASEGLRDVAINAARSAADAWTQAGIAWADGSMSGGEAAKTAVIGSARAAIVAASGEAAAKAIAAHSGIPFIGVAIGLGVAASVAQMILGYLGKLSGLNAGGIVSGGISGRDSIPAMLTPGERVLSTKQTALFERMVSALERGPSMAVSGGGVVVHNEFKSAVPSTSADMSRIARDLSKQLKRAHRRGF